MQTPSFSELQPNGVRNRPPRPERPAALVVERIGGLAALEPLRQEWLALWARAEATPFQAPGAVLAWARSHAPDRTFAVAIRERGRLAGLAVVFSWRGTLLLAATGPTDYGDVLVEPGRPELADLLLSEMARGAQAQAQALVRMELRQLRAGSALLHARAPAGWREARGPDETCPVAPVLGPSGLDGLPARRRRKFEAFRRRAERDGPPAAFTTADSRSLAPAVAQLFRLHAARWERRGEAGVLTEPLMRDFVGRLAPELHADGALRLHRLDLGGRPAAVLLALHDRTGAHLYLSGFDPELERWGPGARLLAHAFQAAADEGIREIHFLRGREPYKYDWGAVDRPTWRRDLTRVSA